jgi:hydroxymethylpyrimidine/phosphomethylpyrimidine kinase
MIRASLPAVKSVLAISGSDPTGGAGLQADLQVIRLFGCHGAGVPSALTIQDSEKVHSVLPLFPSVVLDQIRCLLRDITPDAVKIGMLASDDVVRNVALGLTLLPDEIPIVIDPVLLASDGTPLLERRAWGALEGLFCRATLTTPNLSEAEALTGEDVSSRRGCESAARIFIDEFKTQAVLIKGGHRAGAPDDLLARRTKTGIEYDWLEGEWIEVSEGSVHGTGCALSSAIASGLAVGVDLPTAIDDARKFVAKGLRGATRIGSGAPFLDHTRAS